MHSLTAILIGSKDLLWSGLQAALRNVDGVRLLDDVLDPVDLEVDWERLRPDVILVGGDQVGDGLSSLVCRLRRLSPTSRIVVLANDFSIQDLVELPRIGVAALLLWRELELTTLRDALIAVTSGNVVVASDGVVRSWLDLASRVTSTPSTVTETLTDRERSVLSALARGQSQPEIAAANGVSVRTVKRTMATLMTKLEAPSPSPWDQALVRLA